MGPFKGVCLVFDRENLVKSFEKSFGSCEIYCKEVTYTNNLYPLQESLEQNCKSLLTSEKISFLFQKCQDFRDEQEFQLLLIDKSLKKTDELVSFRFLFRILFVALYLEYGFLGRIN